MFCVHKTVAMSLRLVNTRHGYMVKLPGNKYGKPPDIIKFQKNTPPPDTRKKKCEKHPTGVYHKKGTYRMKLDTVIPNDDLMHKTVDPIKTLYSYQVEPYPSNWSSDSMTSFCSLTKSAEPMILNDISSDLNDVSTASLDRFIVHTEDCIDAFNSFYYQKGLVSKPNTPHEIDKFSKHFSSSFLNNVVYFLFKEKSVRNHLTFNSHLTFNQHTGAFWRVFPTLKGSEKARQRQCNRFQLMNYIDLMMRTTKPISFNSLRSKEALVPLIDISKTCVNNLQYFKRKDQVYQFPGFIRETLYPFNHTIFKVVSPAFSDADLQAVTMISGFGQTFATMQHRLNFTCHVDLIPPVKNPEATNVVVTDGKRYCLGVYQCNTTDTLMEEVSDPSISNQCAIAPVRPLLLHGQVNRELLRDMLSLLTYDKNPCKEELSDDVIQVIESAEFGIQESRLHEVFDEEILPLKNI